MPCGSERRVIESERLVLRPIELGDVDVLVRLDSDPEVMRYLTGRPSTREEVEAVVAEHLGHRWIASDRASGDFVGWFGLVPIGDSSFSVGYRLRREQWGRGLATEGTRLLIATAFDVHGARRVTAETMAVNTRSRSVMERCGMRYTRTFHMDWDDPLPGTEEGEVEYEITREEWQAAHSGDR
ncbi:GNAT family N-acetyltransferase [Desertimonas flava]|uniref:GNAT family N-acetyltransferase n=1 Tax=Desertimonas flava TaxID=2064846 RepID=UPI000E34E331|nr:GNAT family N-acetyltransferase [Desertimonas flava]